MVYRYLNLHNKWLFETSSDNHLFFIQIIKKLLMKNIS